MINNDEIDQRYLIVADDIMGDRNFVQKRGGKEDLFSSQVNLKNITNIPH